MGACICRTVTVTTDETVRMEIIVYRDITMGETVRMETIRMYSPVEFARLQQVEVSRLHATNGLNCTSEYWTIMQVK